MQLRYRFRLYPTRGQRQALARAFGCSRVVYNDAPRAREDARAPGLPRGTGRIPGLQAGERVNEPAT